MAAPDSVLFSVDLPGVADIADNEEVGRVYEVAINGVGYMLADNPETDRRWNRRTVPLEPERFASTETPFSEAIERYAFTNIDTWVGGAGQRYWDRDDSTGSAFYDSEGIDPFSSPGEISLLPATTQVKATTYASPHLTVVGDSAYVITGQNTIEHSSNGTGWSSFTLTDGLEGGSGTLTVEDLTSDGQYWYGATGRSIIRGTTSDPAASWSAQDAMAVQWAADRIFAAVVASGSTPNRLTTLTSAGAEEKTNGHKTHPDGTTVVLGGMAGGFYFYGAYAGTGGAVYAWSPSWDGTTFDVPFLAWDMPAGLIPAAITATAGEVWVRAYRAEGTSAGSADLYRCIPDAQGNLTPFFVAELAAPGGSVDLSQGGFTSYDDHVFFAWPNMASTGDSGIGTVYLPTGGWARWLRAPSTSSTLVRDVAVWKGRPVFTVDTKGVYWESTTAWETSGEITLSVTDAESARDKVWDEVVVLVRPLGSGESVDLELSYDNMGSFNSIGSLDTAGALSKKFTADTKAPNLTPRLTLNGPGTDTPIVHFVSVSYHQLGLADKVLVLPVNCADNLTGLNGAPLPENGPGVGATRARDLEALTQTRVKVQDVDWHLTGSTEIYEVLAVESDRVVGLYDRQHGSAQMTLVSVVTLRKRGAS